MAEPLDGALPPFEALCQFSDPEVLSALKSGQIRYLPSWWVKNSLSSSFFERLYLEELLCWARHQSPAAPWSQLPGTVWQYLRILDWNSGRLGRPQISIHGGLERTMDGDIIYVEEWWDARIAPVGRQERAATRGGKESGRIRAVQPEKVEAVARAVEEKIAESRLSKTRITAIVAKEHGISTATVKRYLKGYLDRKKVGS
jgi:hypothetical protein